jgi:hypothetical protein
MSLSKTQQGRPLRIPAADYNAFVDAARAFRQSNLGGSGLRQSTPNPCVLLAKSATAYPRFAVVSVVDPISTPPGGETVDEGHAEEITVNVDAPAEGDRGIGIVIEPTTPDTLGRVIVSGVAQTFIRVNDADHMFAVPIDGNTEKLDSAESGLIEVLWKGTGDNAPCIVRIGGGGSVDPELTTIDVIGDIYIHESETDGRSIRINRYTLNIPIDWIINQNTEELIELTACEDEEDE